MLTRTGFDLLRIGISVAIIVPTVAITFIVGRHLSSAGMVALFVLLVALLAVVVTGLVRSTREGRT